MSIDRTTVGERAWVRAFAEMNSSKVKEYGMILSSEEGSIMRLSDYLVSSRNMDFLKNLQKENLDVNNLDSVYIVFGPASKGELKGMNEIGQIINIGRNDVFKDLSGAYYRDLATIIPDGDSRESEFRLDDKIKREMKSTLRGAVDPETEDKEFDIESIDELTDHIAKGKRLCPKDKKEVRTRTEEAGGEIDEEEFADSQEELKKKLAEQEEGKQLLESSGIEITDDLKKQLTSMGVYLADVKQVTTVESPEILSESLGENGNIAPEGKAYIISVRNHEANAKGDRMITLQDGRVGDSRENDDKIRDFKKKYGEDSNVISRTDPEEETVSYRDANGKEQKEILIGEESENIVAIEQKILEIELRVKQQLDELEERTDLEPLQKQQEETQILGNAYAEVEKLQNETGVQLPNISEQYLARANESVEKEEVEMGKEVISDVGEAIFDPMAKYADGRIPKYLQD